MSVINFASTMITLMVSNPLIPVLDLTSLRLVSCGGSPQSPATIIKAIAAFGCEFFVSLSPAVQRSASLNTAHNAQHAAEFMVLNMTSLQYQGGAARHVGGVRTVACRARGLGEA